MFEKLLSKIGAGLANHGLPYMIIGGQAVLLYGEPRLTKDIDIDLAYIRKWLHEFDNASCKNEFVKNFEQILAL